MANSTLSDRAENSTLEERTSNRHATRDRAELGFWFFLLGDMILFGIYFLVLLEYRNESPALFSQGRSELSPTIGALNTAILLTSSYLVVAGLDAVRRKDPSAAERAYALAALLGGGFATIKLWEWLSKIDEGLYLTTNDFFMFYFALTGVHFLHVCIGIGVLFYLAVKARRHEFREADTAVFEGGGAYWHMVDLVWLIIFPLLYLVV